MNKLDCAVIKDLLPLYVDDVCSEKSKDLIEEAKELCFSKNDLNIEKAD